MFQTLKQEKGLFKSLPSLSCSFSTCPTSLLAKADADATEDSFCLPRNYENKIISSENEFWLSSELLIAGYEILENFI